jgi:hypothetical protein
MTLCTPYRVFSIIVTSSLRSAINLSDVISTKRPHRTPGLTRFGEWISSCNAYGVYYWPGYHSLRMQPTSVVRLLRLAVGLEHGTALNKSKNVVLHLLVILLVMSDTDRCSWNLFIYHKKKEHCITRHCEESKTFAA